MARWSLLQQQQQRQAREPNREEDDLLRSLLKRSYVYVPWAKATSEFTKGKWDTLKLF